MVILALETVTRQGSYALWADGACQASAGASTATHGERLPAEVVDWLAAHGRTPADIDLFAVVSGPGSFTGLRVGLAAIQGFAFAAGRPVIGVPTLEALATAWHAAHPDDRLIVACQDGQRGEVFYAAWRPSAGDDVLDEASAVIPPGVGRPAEVAAAVAAVAAGEAATIVGDGAVRYHDAFASLGRTAPAPVTLAEAAVRVAAARPDRGGAPHALRPIYLRRPDAVLARERAGLAPPGPLDAFTVTLAGGADDLRAVAALQGETFTNPWGADAMQWELDNTDVARLYVMRAPGGRVVAFCACWIVFDELHINSLAVGPEWRRRGLATRLLRRVFDEAKAAGVRAATLEVRASNQAARGLYQRLAFTVEATRRDYYQNPREDALILWNRALI